MIQALSVLGIVFGAFVALALVMALAGWAITSTDQRVEELAGVVPRLTSNQKDDRFATEDSLTRYLDDLELCTTDEQVTALHDRGTLPPPVYPQISEVSDDYWSSPPAGIAARHHERMLDRMDDLDARGVRYDAIRTMDGTIISIIEDEPEPVREHREPTRPHDKARRPIWRPPHGTSEEELDRAIKDWYAIRPRTPWEEDMFARWLEELEEEGIVP